jgi:branched-chain amino acid transport system substrate-binding protein
MIVAAGRLESIVPTTAIENCLFRIGTRGGRAMPLKHLVLGLAIVATIPTAFTTAEAADGLYVPLLTYRTGPFAGSGIPYANGLTYYLNMLNQRDGGIGGIKLIIEECETGYDTKKGVECYDSVKGKNPVVVTPLSTGVTLQLIPKAVVDKIPIFSMAYGLSASADGNLLRLPSRRTAP